MKPTLYMMVGLPGSGKSTFANDVLKHEPCADDMFPHNRCVVHSSDVIRAELFGDESSQDDNVKVFQILHKRIREDLRNGVDVVYDACNIHKRRRAAFLQSLNKIDCRKVCYCIITPYRVCVNRQNGRKRKVPIDAIKKMYMNWTPPHRSEGFDEICIDVQSWVDNPFHTHLDTYDQHNSHHNLALGIHMKVAAAYTLQHMPDDINLTVAALLHDIGKPFCRTFENKKGITDTDAHYYNHQNVSAYDSFFYLKGFDPDDQFDIANLIYYHMHPYTSWVSDKSLRRDIRLCGQDFVDRVMMLHLADRHAH